MVCLVRQQVSVSKAKRKYSKIWHIGCNKKIDSWEIIEGVPSKIMKEKKVLKISVNPMLPKDSNVVYGIKMGG